MPKLRLKSRSSLSLSAHGCLLTLPIRSILLHFLFLAAPSEREDLVSHGPNFCCLQPKQYQPVFVPNWKWSVCDCRPFFLCTVRHGHVKQSTWEGHSPATVASPVKLSYYFLLRSELQTLRFWSAAGLFWCNPTVWLGSPNYNPFTIYRGVKWNSSLMFVDHLQFWREADLLFLSLESPTFD